MDLTRRIMVSGGVVIPSRNNNLEHENFKCRININFLTVSVYAQVYVKQHR